MTDATASSPPAPLSALEAFFQHVQTVNPFLDNRVNGPAPGDADAEEVHAAGFARLTALAEETRQARQGIGVVLWGEAGIGKSHLLARLGRWAGQDHRADFVYLHNLQAAPDHLPRSLLHTTVSLLTAGRRRHFVSTPLFALARAGVLAAVHGVVRYHTWEGLERAHVSWLDGLGQLGLIDRTAHDVLFRFFRSAWRAQEGKEDGSVAELAVRWLAGQALDPVEAHLLGLPRTPSPHEPVALLDNQQIKLVLAALARLAACAGRPLMLAFDQVDNLDTDQAAALARFLEAVLDSAPNLFVVTAGVQHTLFRWRHDRVIQESAWDRLGQLEIGLQRLSAAEVLAVVQRRLHHFLAPFAGLEPVRLRLEADPLFPLGRAWQARFVEGKLDLRPRDAINWAREGWREQQQALRAQGGPSWLAAWGTAPAVPVVVAPPATEEEVQALIDRKVDEKMAAHRAARQREPEGLPADPDHLAGLLYHLLDQCREAGVNGLRAVERVPPPRRGARPSYDLALVRRADDLLAVRTGVLVLLAANANSVTGFLRRLLEDSRPLDRLVLVTEERVGLPLGARGREYLDELRERQGGRFRHLELTFAEYAGLEAVQAVVGEARSGELEVEPRPGQARRVTPEEVVASHRRQGRYLGQRLLRELLSPAADVASSDGAPSGAQRSPGSGSPGPAPLHPGLY